MNANPATIFKEGKLININEDDLCEGDVVVVQAGDIVPADLKLVEARALEIDEFELTGEIMPVSKKVEGNDDVLIYKGSRVLKGTGKGIVVATGEQTEYGKVLKQELEQDKPYTFRIFKIKYLGIVGLLLPAFVVHSVHSKNEIAIITFYLLSALALVLLQNNELFKYLLISRELKRLGRLGMKIRDANALERMNRIDILCFDKTGVLTTRYMDVKNLYFADKGHAANDLDEGIFDLIKLACALCHDVLFFEKMELANPIDKAFISFALKNRVNVKEILSRSNRIYDKPFDSENRYMACGFQINGKIYYFVKGDPSAVLRMCDSFVASNGTKEKVDLNYWRVNNSNMDAIEQAGDTAIALAYTSGIPDHIPSGYTFLCLCRLENTLQPGVREIIKEITDKGKRSILLTGDRAETAVRISKDCGISQDSRACLTGRSIDKMELSEVARQSSYCSVFARLLPAQKGVIIRLLQQKGHCVAMVGDGPNDGIALKVADVGISFVKNSSPIARKLSKILINDLADLPRLIEGAYKVQKTDKYLTLFRTLAIILLFLSVYAWVLLHTILGG